MKSFILVLFLVFLSFFLSLAPAPVLYAEEKEAASEEGPGQSVPTLGNQHISSLRAPHAPYNSVPPTSGPHTHNVAQWGVYRQQVPDELQVHNLEDGGVMIQYDCSGCKDLMKQLESLVRSYYKKAKAEEKESGGRSKYQHIIVGPYKNIGNKIALTAWGKIDKFDEFDEGRIRKFIEAYVGIDHHPR
ncbi:MAG: DUF3105 domain-containing protein [Nitrospirae bacterium]|nr:DUF3105 domain-containing protein [Candidatus Manganitrophaceae bacterium]